jgi:hypothetical protein
LKIGGYDTGPKPSELGAPAEAPLAPSGDASDWIEVASAKDLAFKSKAAKDSLAVKPMYRVTDEKYAVYWGTEKQI